MVPVVPHVPVCTYAHVREGNMQFAERVKKKTGTKWDRDQLGCAVRSLTREKNAPAASSGRFLGLVKDNTDARV
jgi:hypothetical protein